MSKTIFCPKCHKLAAQIVESEDGVKIMQNGKSLINFGKGSSGNSLSVNCPDKHPVSLKV